MLLKPDLPRSGNMTKSKDKFKLFTIVAAENASDTSIAMGKFPTIFLCITQKTDTMFFRVQLFPTSRNMVESRATRTNERWYSFPAHYLAFFAPSTLSPTASVCHRHQTLIEPQRLLLLFSFFAFTSEDRPLIASCGNRKNPLEFPPTRGSRVSSDEGLILLLRYLHLPGRNRDMAG